MPLAEAVASGIPAVIRDDPVLRETGGPGALLVPEATPEAWAAALERIITDDALHAVLREAGLRRGQRFSWDPMGGRAGHRRPRRHMSLRVGVVTVTYRGGDTPLGWAAALREAARAAGDAVDLHAVAVDNASDDGTAERLRAAEPRLDVVELEDNLGFAAGCNVGLARLDAPDGSPSSIPTCSSTVTSCGSSRAWLGGRPGRAWSARDRGRR